uniref:Uncharacterized protein n=1 Tax=Anopheles quadriannulatus TaxID=34691 RepID=A0A182WVP2_ANOQN
MHLAGAKVHSKHLEKSSRSGQIRKVGTRANRHDKSCHHATVCDIRTTGPRRAVQCGDHRVRNCWRSVGFPRAHQLQKRSHDQDAGQAGASSDVPKDRLQGAWLQHGQARSSDGVHVSDGVSGKDADSKRMTLEEHACLSDKQRG